MNTIKRYLFHLILIFFCFFAAFYDITAVLNYSNSDLMWYHRLEIILFMVIVFGGTVLWSVKQLMNKEDFYLPEEKKSILPD